MQCVLGFRGALHALKCQQPLLTRRVVSAATSDTTLKKLMPPEPGTVKSYDHHLFLEVAGQKATDWPSKAEALPILMRAFGALAKHKDSIRGTVKVTAFVSPQDASSLRNSGCSALIFPAGVGVNNMPAGDMEALVVNHLLDEPGQASHGGVEYHLGGLHLFVCTHGSRDKRCGILGSKVVERLRSVVRSRSLSDKVTVYECSHVGGHKYAGNVLVFGAISPSDGDWFGGVQPENAADFLSGLTDAEVGSEGGIDSAVLRPFWRGRMGMSKDEQREAFFNGTCACDSGSEAEW